MKVLVFTNMYPYEGDSSYGIFVKEQVDALRAEIIEVDVLFINARRNKLSYISGIFQFLRKCHRSKYDLIHAQHTFCAAITLLQRKLPVILTFHEGEASATLKTKLREIVHKPHKLLVCSFNLKKLIIKLVDQVIFVARHQKNLFTSDKSVVIPCGIDFNLFRPIPAALARSKLELSNDRKIVLFPSSPKVIGKRFDIAKGAVRIVKKAGVNVELISLNHIPHEEVSLYTNASDVVLITSDYEASPMVVKEAMACNIPIVSTGVGDTKKIIGDTEGCFICERDPEDIALKIKMALDYGRRTEGRERIIELGLELQQISRKIINIYKETLRRS